MDARKYGTVPYDDYIRFCHFGSCCEGWASICFGGDSELNVCMLFCVSNECNIKACSTTKVDIVSNSRDAVTLPCKL
jgi:hypothetical protein